jgi:hypothetical protein
MRRNYASASTATNYLRDLRPAQVAQMVREGSLAITHADIGNDYHTVTLFEDGAGENRRRVEAKWFVPGEEWYDLSLGLRDGKVDPATADLFLGPSGWDKREREEQTRAAAKRKGITIDASRHYFNNPRRPLPPLSRSEKKAYIDLVIVGNRRNPRAAKATHASSVTPLPWWKRAYDERETWHSYQRAPWQLRAGPAENWPALLDVYTTGGRDALHSWFVDKYPKMQDADIDKRVEAFMEGLPTLREYARARNPAPKYICTNDRYCPTPDTFSSLSDFQAMCQAVFGVRVPLASIGGDTYVDERGEVVLRPASRRPARRPAAQRKNPPKGFRIAGPAVKTMVDGLRISKADAQKLKDMMDTGAPRILQTADKMMNGHGVERISGVGGGLMYVNMGDTYDATLIYDYKTNRFVVSSWGDIVERQPRRFAD